METIVSTLLRRDVDGQYCPLHFSSSSPATSTPEDLCRATCWFYESQLWPAAKDSAIVRLSCVGTCLSDVVDFIPVTMTSRQRPLFALRAVTNDDIELAGRGLLMIQLR